LLLAREGPILSYESSEEQLYEQNVTSVFGRQKTPALLSQFTGCYAPLFYFVWCCGIKSRGFRSQANERANRGDY